jgi:hypothetical protein
MSDLVLHVSREYFDAIRSGEKIFEYRRMTPYWKRRIEPNQFKRIERVVICWGYPARDDDTRRLVFPWRGYEVQTITHEHFGGEAHVYAIRLTPVPADAEHEQATGEQEAPRR